MFLPYIGMATILVNAAEPFKRLSTRLRRRIRVKSGEMCQALSEKKSLRDYTILQYVNSQGIRADNTQEKYIGTKTFYIFNHTL